jgi:FkbM family methyltransferase
MNSWTVDLFRQTKPFLSPFSFLQYRDFLRHEPQTPSEELLKLRLKSPVGRPVFLRKWGSDPLTFDEVFIEQVYRPVVANLDSCRTLIDLGANIGLASLYLSSHFNCRCVCVEPNPDTFRILKMNFAGTDTQLLHAAVWSSETTVAADCPEAHFSMSKVAPALDGQIPGLPITAIIRRSGFESVDLLKIDIEGAEVEVFRGDLSWLNAVRAIAIEFHGDSRKQTAFDAVMQRFHFRVIEGGHTTLAIRS